MTEPQDPFAPPPEGTGPSLSKDPVPSTPPPPYGAPAPAPYGAPAPAPYGAPLPGGQRRNGMGTAALVLGLVGLIPCFWFAFVPAVLAIVFGVIGRGRAARQEATNRGMATTGIVTGIVSVVLGVALWGLVIANEGAINRYTDCADAHQGDSVATEQCAKDFVHDVFGVDVQ